MRNAMKKSCRVQVVCLFLAGMISLPVRAEVIPGRWEKVSNLDLGMPVTVVLKNGDRVVGDYEGMSGSEVDVETRSARAVIPKADIQFIRTRKTGGVGEKAAVGAKIGAAVGAGVPLIGFARSGPGDLNGFGVALIVLAVTGVGTAIGAGLGAVAGIGTKTEEFLVYEAPPTRR